MKKLKRCSWSEGSEIYHDYHDKEWGVIVHDDQKLFEMIILEGAQAGLSWITVLKKREEYRKVFSNFDALKVSKFTDKKLEKILLNPGVIRNRLKIYSVRKNAIAFLRLQKEHGSFDKYIWSFVDGKTITNKFKSNSDALATSPESDAMSKALKKEGFSFVGSTICYAYMQACGMVNDHYTYCFRHKEV